MFAACKPQHMDAGEALHSACLLSTCRAERQRQPEVVSLSSGSSTARTWILPPHSIATPTPPATAPIQHDWRRTCNSAPANLLHRRELFTDHCTPEDTISKGQGYSSEQPALSISCRISTWLQGRLNNVSLLVPPVDSVAFSTRLLAPKRMFIVTTNNDIHIDSNNIHINTLPRK